MGIPEAMASTADGVKIICSSAYVLGAAAVNTVRDTVSNPDGQKRIARTTWIAIDQALEHGTPAYTGGIPVYRILKEAFSK